MLVRPGDDTSCRYREKIWTEIGCFLDDTGMKLETLVDALFEMTCGNSHDMNDQLKIDRLGSDLDDFDDDTTFRTCLDDDTVHTDASTLHTGRGFNSNHVQRAVYVIKKHASRHGVSVAELLQTPELLQGIRNQQGKGSGALDNDTRGSDLDDDTFLSYFDDDTTLHTFQDDETFYNYNKTDGIHAVRSFKKRLAAIGFRRQTRDPEKMDDLSCKTL